MLDFAASPVIGLPPLVVTFTATSAVSGTCNWDFGDGSTSSEQNPVHTYASPGVYAVSLAVTSGGLTDTVTKTGYVYVVGQTVVLSSDVLVGSQIEGDHGSQVLVETYLSRNEYGGEMVKEIRSVYTPPAAGDPVPTLEERLAALESAVLTLTGV